MGASCTCLNQTKEKTDYILDSNRAKEIGNIYFFNKIYKVNEISRNARLIKNLIGIQSKIRGLISRNKIRHLVKSNKQMSSINNQFKPLANTNTRIVNFCCNLKFR